MKNKRGKVKLRESPNVLETSDDQDNVSENDFHSDMKDERCIDQDKSDDDNIEEGFSTGEMKKKRKNEKSIIRKEAEKYSERLAKRGVIYVSRIPPFMKPNKLRNLLERYGEITRLYLAEEDASVRKRRKANGGNGSKQFVEGWVEFSDRKVAREVSASLNNTRIGEKKRDYYHDDMWNLKYLKGFKWDHLTEKFAYERRVRESKLKAAMMQAKRQNAEFVELLDKDEAYQHVKQRGLKRQNEDEQVRHEDGKRSKRSFRQLQPSSIVMGTDQPTMHIDVVNSIFSRPGNTA